MLAFLMALRSHEKSPDKSGFGKTEGYIVKYHIYKNEFEAVSESGAKQGLSLSQLFMEIDRLTLAESGRVYPDTMDCQVHCAEWNWIEHGKDIIFLEDQETIDRLMALRFKPTMAARTPLPYPTFTLAIPKGAHYKGHKLTPILINSFHAFDGMNRLASRYFEHIDYPLRDRINYGVDEGVELSLFINEEADTWKGAKTVINTSWEQVQAILQIDIDDVEAMHGISKQYRSGLTLTDEDLRQQIIAIRLIAALCIYNQATDGKYLRDGVPYGFANKPKFLGMAKKDYPTFNKASIKLGSLNEGAKRGEYICGEYMRQLVDDRYYQGEFAKWEKGTRWVTVSEHLRGGKAHTQEVADEN